MKYFLLTFIPKPSKDVQSNLPNIGYIYFAHLTESNRREEMVEISYNLHWAAVVLSLGAYGKWDLFAPRNLRNDKEVLLKPLDFILLEKEK